MYDSLEKTPPRPRDLFYIFPLLLFCADGVPFYTLSLEKWYAVIPTVLATISSFFRACSIPFSKVLSILKVVKDAEKLSFFLRLSGCLIKKRVSFLQKSVWHKDEEKERRKLTGKKQIFHQFSFSFAVLRKEFEVPPYSQSVELGSQIQLRCHPPKGVPNPRVSLY